MQKNTNYIKVTQHKSIYIYVGKKREIKSKMCNRIKSAKQIRCAKTVYWELINSNMNKRDVQEGCANGLYRVCTHSSNTDENMNVFVMTGQRRVDPFAVRYLLDRGRIKQAKVSGQKQEYQRQGRDVNNTRQKSGSQAQVQSSKIGQSGVKHRDKNQQDG